MINNVVYSTVSIQWAGLFVSTIAGWVRVPLVDNFGVVSRDKFFEIGGGPVGHFHGVPVNNFMEWVIFWEMLIQELEKYFSDAGFYIC